MSDAPESAARFEQLCAAVLRLAELVEQIDRNLDPEGPFGWEIRESRQIVNAVRDIVASTGGAEPKA